MNFKDSNMLGEAKAKAKRREERDSKWAMSQFQG